LNGFNGNDTIASGDDVFLLQKHCRVSYLKSPNNIVITKPLDNWKSLCYQRVRWASKTVHIRVLSERLGLLVFAGICVGFWVLGFVSLV
jgi:hypothetical protein